jgi:CRISPR-associated protein Cas2
MFDLPVETAAERRAYRQFVKFIKKEGFIMFQESIYVKLSINEASSNALRNIIKNHVPPKGMISMMTVTERQFSGIDFMLGDFVTDVINNDQRVIEL